MKTTLYELFDIERDPYQTLLGLKYPEGRMPLQNMKMLLGKMRIKSQEFDNSIRNLTINAMLQLYDIDELFVSYEEKMNDRPINHMLVQGFCDKYGWDRFELADALMDIF